MYKKYKKKLGHSRTRIWRTVYYPINNISNINNKNISTKLSILKKIYIYKMKLKSNFVSGYKSNDIIQF